MYGINAKSEFLVLDEPTNDLDITTLQVLEEYLADFEAVLLLLVMTDILWIRLLIIC